MTRGEALTMIRTMFETFGIESVGLNELDLGGVAIAGGRVGLSFDKNAGTLTCDALIYRFPRPLAPERWSKIEAESRKNIGPGVQLHYDPLTRYLSLRQTYINSIPGETFALEINQLRAASLELDMKLLDSVLETVAAS